MTIPDYVIGHCIAITFMVGVIIGFLLGQNDEGQPLPS